MSELKKDHILETGASALVAGAAGAAAGSLLGPAGMTLGAIAAGAAGAVAGDKLVEAMDARGDLGHFEQVYTHMAYYVPGMTWEDYRPAYEIGILLEREGLTLDAESFRRDWGDMQGASRLNADQALAAAEHAFREMQQTS